MIINQEKAVEIADRTAQIFKDHKVVRVAAYKALELEYILCSMKKNIVHFLYTDETTGSLLEAWGTRQKNLLKDIIQEGNDIPDEDGMVTFYDVKRAEIRSFRYSRYVGLVNSDGDIIVL